MTPSMYALVRFLQILTLCIAPSRYVLPARYRIPNVYGFRSPSPNTCILLEFWAATYSTRQTFVLQTIPTGMTKVKHAPKRS
jgi:hypothetical protein